jgi:sialate O-acetylesterase
MSAVPETLGEFSGTAYFFAKKIYEKHTVPVGLLVASEGGTPLESWMSRESLAAFPHKIAKGEKFADTRYREETIRESSAAVLAWQDNLTKNDRGLAEKWYVNGLDDSFWQEITLPSYFSTVGLGGFCGVLWFRRNIMIPSGWADGDVKIWLGTVVDADHVYWNGTEIGNITYRYPPRKYIVPPGLLREGQNQITLRITCNNGNGGFIAGKSFRIFSGDRIIELGGNWKYNIGVASPPCPEGFFIQREPMGLFNAMIAPLLKYPVRGMLWYQGESNTDNIVTADEYAALFTALIQDWRDKKGQGNLPFLFVQLPLFGEQGENCETSGWALVREAQKSALKLPVTGMAAALDLGEWNDLHPLNKKEVGNRLALTAEAVVYHESNTAPGPVLDSIKRTNKKLVLCFKNCGRGLIARTVPYVSIVANREVKRTPAVIEGPDCLSIDISRIENPQKVLYAWADNPTDRQLYNAGGLPVIPFRAGI